MAEATTETETHPGESKEGLDVAPFKSLTHYSRPEAPAEDRFRTAWARFRRVFREAEAAPFVADDTLRETIRSTLDGMAAPPACAPLLHELEREFDEWKQGTGRGARLQLIVLPPCEEASLLSIWAEKHDLEVLAEPKREHLLRESRPASQFLDDQRGDSTLLGEGILVIPKLERWFLRHKDGLALIRSLVQAVLASDRRILIGCSSWAWEFLSKAIDLSLVVPAPQTFKPFDASRLRYWFAQLAADDVEHRYLFRFSKSGSVMDLEVGAALGDTGPTAEATSETCAYFERLSARSRGIPWVAWHLWRRGMRSLRDDASPVQEHDRKDERTTLWVTALDETKLPENHGPEEMLVLQALLIHGQLTRKELDCVLPGLHFTGIVQALIGAGFIEFVGEQLRCMPAAYPTFRADLLGAGFPMDSL